MFKSVPHKDKLKNVSNYCTDCLKCQVLNQAPCLTKIQVQPHPWYFEQRLCCKLWLFIARQQARFVWRPTKPPNQALLTKQLTFKNLHRIVHNKYSFLRQQDKYPKQLHTILGSNSKLLFQFMLLLKHNTVFKHI